MDKYKLAICGFCALLVLSVLGVVIQSPVVIIVCAIIWGVLFGVASFVAQTAEDSIK